MSLKFFHIVFISLSSFLSFGFGLWCLKSVWGNPIDTAFRDDFGSLNLLIGIVSLMIGIGLIVYGKRFLKKLKDLGY